MKDIIKTGVILFGICLVAAVLLAFVNSITEEPIAEQVKLRQTKAMQSVIPDAEFNELTDLGLNEDNMIKSIFEATIDNNVVGYAFNLKTSEGYNGDIELVVGINTDGVITGIDIITQSETPGLGANSDKPVFKDQYKDKPAQVLSVVKDKAKAETEISAISGATITSRAVTNAVNEAIAYYKEVIAKEAK